MDRWVVFRLGEVRLPVRVNDVEMTLSRVASSRPVYGNRDDVLLVSRDPAAGQVTVCYVPAACERMTFVVAESAFGIRVVGR